MLNLSEVINVENVKKAFENFDNAKPFPHTFIDNFFKEDFALALEKEFPDFTSNQWHKYNNQIEVKKTCNDWNFFPKNTYQAFTLLNSPEFVDLISSCTNVTPLFRDEGLNGGGWHIHGKGGKLNTHLDYSIHPKLGLERKLNIIIYLNSSWEENWGGHLGLWSHNEEKHQPEELKSMVKCKFNRAAIFDTTCNSWHGLPDPLTCPDNQQRKSLAVYYLTTPAKNAPERGKALFAPTEEQKDNQEVLDLIKTRSNVETADKVWRK